MNCALEVLFLRKPRIDYISPPVCEALFSSSGGPVIVLNPLVPQAFPTGLILGGAGGFSLSWDAYPGALCYSVYKANTNNPFGTYTIVAECIPNPPINLGVFGPGDYRVSAITTDGETPLSLPIHFASVVCPSITGPADEDVRIVSQGEAVALGPVPVNPGSGGIVTYIWHKNGVPYQDTTSTTTDTLNFESPVISDSGTYMLLVSNAADPSCGVLSEPIYLAVGLEAYWTLQNTLFDSVQAIPFSILVGNTFSPGIVGEGGHLTSNNSSALFGTAYTPQLAYLNKGITLWGWFKVDAVAGTYNFGTQYVYDLTSSDTASLQILFESSTGMFKSSLTNFDSVQSIFVSTPALSPGWHFYVVWYDVSDKHLRVQFDNGAVNTAAGVIGIPDGSGGTAEFQFLAQSIGGGSAISMGFDECAVFQGVLAPQVRTFLYNAGAARTFPF